MNLALTSDFPATANDAVCAALRASSSQPRIAWLAPASASRAAFFARAVRELGALGFWRIECITVGEAPRRARPARLDEFDAVVLSGGDPVAFRNDLLRSGTFAELADRIRGGHCVVASSGGAMQLTPNVSLFRLETVPVERVIADRERFRAMGATPFELLPHLNRCGEALLERVARYSARANCDVLALADGAAWLCDEAGVRIVGEALSFCAGERETLSP